MSRDNASRVVGIKEARPILGDLVTAVQQGTDVVLTRNGKPAARIIRYHNEDPAVAVTLAPSHRRFVEAVARGEAVQLRRDNPYRTVVKGSDRAVPKTVLDAVKDLVRVDHSSGAPWERPYVLTDAGKAALEDE